MKDSIFLYCYTCVCVYAGEREKLNINKIKVQPVRIKSHLLKKNVTRVQTNTSESAGCF